MQYYGCECILCVYVQLGYGSYIIHLYLLPIMYGCCKDEGLLFGFIYLTDWTGKMTEVQYLT
jgi:hypothetical protein